MDKGLENHIADMFPVEGTLTFDNGTLVERERIIKLLEANFHRFDLSNNGVDYPMGLDQFIALIKGETE